MTAPNIRMLASSLITTCENMEPLVGITNLIYKGMVRYTCASQRYVEGLWTKAVIIVTVIQVKAFNYQGL